ncbi:MAG: hypothetical protein AAF363_05835 [Bacteroidota bacterium]
MSFLEKSSWLKRNVLHLIILVSGTLAILAYFRYTQLTLNYQEAPLFDGNQYLKVYQNFRSETKKTVSFPYNTRILVPFLALEISNFLGFTALKSFEYLNYIFTILSVLSLFILWKNLKIKDPLIAVGFFWLLFHWTGILRLNQFDPITVDVPLYFFQTLLLILLWSKRYVWIIPTSMISTAQKESMIGLLAILFALELWRFWKHRSNRDTVIFLFLSIIFSVLTKAYLDYNYPPAEEGKFFHTTILLRAMQVLLDPFLLIRWITAIFVAFGAFIITSLCLKIKDFRFTEFEQQIGVLSITYFLFGLFAGGDILRIVFLGFPFIMTFCLLQLKNASEKVWLLVIFSSFPLLRVRKSIPSPTKNWTGFTEWYPEYASQTTVLFYFAYGVVIVALAYFFLFRSKSSKT